VLLIAQGFHIATHCKDRFGMLIAVGFTLQIGLQAFINIAVVSNVMPNTGISLPFFSYGGTALMMQLAQMGIVLNVSRGRYVVGEERQRRKSNVRVSTQKSTA
ncbi:MAG: FtsW/RodA/SpoVE family cell cycle protein, partial [Oscillospiraceae bacterium]|nr:FtsW/RodA/SpoVE family cell cycle protein [Oscillospiraceae bacterium]